MSAKIVLTGSGEKDWRAGAAISKLKSTYNSTEINGREYVFLEEPWLGKTEETSSASKLVVTPDGAFVQVNMDDLGLMGSGAVPQGGFLFTAGAICSEDKPDEHGCFPVYDLTWRSEGDRVALDSWETIQPRRLGDLNSRYDPVMNRYSDK